MPGCRSSRCAMPARCRRDLRRSACSSSASHSWRKWRNASQPRARRARSPQQPSCAACKPVPQRCSRAPAAPLDTAAAAAPAAPDSAAPRAASAPAAAAASAVERVRGEKVAIEFEARRCIHSRYCVTWAPQVFLANVPGAWIHPDAMSVEQVVEVAHACPSGAIRYRRLDGGAQEGAPPVNLASVREAGPYAAARRAADRWGRGRLSRHAVPLRRVEEQALLRRLAPRDRLRRHGRAAERRQRRAAGARWSPGGRPAAERPAARARQPRDRQRHRPGGGAHHDDLPVPLRRQREQAVLRRHARAHRLQVVTACGRGARGSCRRATARRKDSTSCACVPGCGAP